MNKFLALFGSGEFTSKISSVDKFLLGKIDNPKVAIFPTAAGKESLWNKWISDGEKHYQKLGAVAKGFPVVDKKTANDEKIAKELTEYNFFIFSGGDPGYLYDSLVGSLVWKKIMEKYEKGAVLVGSSAGAMIMGPKQWGAVYEYDNHGKLLPWSRGFGLVDFGVLPHFDVIPSYYSENQIEEIKSVFPKNLEIVGIDEDTAYVNINGKWKVMGKGSVHRPASL